MGEVPLYSHGSRVDYGIQGFPVNKYMHRSRQGHLPLGISLPRAVRVLIREQPLCRGASLIRQKNLLGHYGRPERGTPVRSSPTKGPMWGYPRGRFWDLGTILEPFCGKLLPKVDKPVKN